MADLGEHFKTRALATQRRYAERELSVWGSEDCHRCGGCCHYYINKTTTGIIKAADEVCPDLVVDGGIAACRGHGGSKPGACRAFACYGPQGGDLDKEWLEVRYRLMLASVNGVGSKTEREMLEKIEMAE